MIDYDLLDFEDRDDLDAETDASYAALREEITGFPVRP